MKNSMHFYKNPTKYELEEIRYREKISKLAGKNLELPSHLHVPISKRLLHSIHRTYFNIDDNPHTKYINDYSPINLRSSIDERFEKPMDESRTIYGETPIETEAVARVTGSMVNPDFIPRFTHMGMPSYTLINVKIGRNIVLEI